MGDDEKEVSENGLGAPKVVYRFKETQGVPTERTSSKRDEESLNGKASQIRRRRTRGKLVSSDEAVPVRELEVVGVKSVCGRRGVSGVVGGKGSGGYEQGTIRRP